MFPSHRTAMIRGAVLPALLLAIVAAAAHADASDRFVSRTRQLTFEGRRAGEGYFSPDGKKLILQSERYPGNPFFQIYILDLVNGRCRLVSPGVGRTTCSFLRPGTDEVEFASTHLDPQAKERQRQEYEDRARPSGKHIPWVYDEFFDVFACDPHGRNLRRLTKTFGYDAEGAYSPDGKQIVFASLRDAYPLEELTPEQQKMWGTQPAYFAEIYVMNADGSDQRRLTDWPGYDGGPFFTADGQRIIWRHFDEGGMLADVYTMKTDGSDRRRLTDFGCMSWAPFMHPSGEYAIFTANKLGFDNFEIFIVDALGEKEPIRVTYTPGFDGLPVFSPDGNTLCWTTNRPTLEAQRGQLFIADWDDPAARAAIKAAPPRRTAPPAPSVASSNSKASTEATDASPPDRKTDATARPAAQKTDATDRAACQQADAAVPPAGMTPRTSWPCSGPPQEKSQGLSPAVTQPDLYTHVSYLASDDLEGRMTGSQGARKAADYVAARFKEAGLQPLGDQQTYFQEFDFPAGIELVPEECTLSVLAAETGQPPRAQKVNQDFAPLSFSASATVESEVVFAGYGLVVPEEPGKDKYDSYEDLNVENKIVLVLDDVPIDLSTDERIRLGYYSSPRYKARLAEERGAAGFLLVIGPNSPAAGTLVPLGRTDSEIGIAAASVTVEATESMLPAKAPKLAVLQKQLDGGKIPEAHHELPSGARIKLAAQLNRKTGSCRNVVGLLPAVGDNRIADEYVMVGAHYDHLGHGETGSSRARADEQGRVHNGADDNASGVATVLELAAALADAHQKADGAASQRGVIFACWSGEEIGVIGSSYFARHPPCPLGQIAAYVNFDMVGRLNNGRLVLQAVGSSPDWLRLIEMINIRQPLAVVTQDDPYLPTDTHEFYPAGIPVLAFFTDVHEDYHRPTDDTDTLNYAGMESIARFGREMVSELATQPDRPRYTAIQRSKPRGDDQAVRRIYTGTIPDFTASGVKGMKISGVQGGSPAEKAGLQAGDVIVEVGGHKIGSLQDYADVLRALKPDKTIGIVVMRGDQELKIEITPTVRK